VTCSKLATSAQTCQKAERELYFCKEGFHFIPLCLPQLWRCSRWKHGEKGNAEVV